MWAFYLVGIVAAAALAKTLRATLFRGEAAPFVMELPPYRLPTIQGMLLHVWDRGRMYLRKAGTLILAASVVLWAMTSFPKPPGPPAAGPAPAPGARRAAELEYSVAGRIGKALEPATRPIGFDWRINTALVGAVAAKEVLVAQMGIVYSIGEGPEEVPLQEELRRHYTPLQAVAIMLFCLLGLPCMATAAVTWSESGSWRWMLLQWGGLTAFAYVATLVVYQVGSLLGLGSG
jgi:ferrous iron transport protein B